MKENFANFATTTLVTSSLTTGSTSFVVSSGQGALFPSSQFAITMDTEIMFITSRTSDTFTVGTRGFDGSTAATHSAGATIQLCTIAYNYNHLWQNVTDTFLPDVAPINSGTTPTSYDHEFETNGNALWTLYPNSGLPAGTTFSIGTTLKSYLLFHRSSTDNVLYTAYVPFTASAPWVATCKISHSVSLAVPPLTAECHFFVSDQTNPTSSSDGGNRIRLDSILLPNQSGTFQGQNILASTAHTVRMLKDVSGSGTQISSYVPIPLGIPLYFRIACASSGIYSGYIGDGVTYWFVGTFTTTFSVQSLGFQFYVPTAGYAQTVAIDWVRVVTATFPTYFGN